MYKFILFVVGTEAFITDNNTGLSVLQNLLLVKTLWVGWNTFKLGQGGNSKRIKGTENRVMQQFKL